MKDNDELYDKAKSFAKSETDKEIATLKAKQTDLENKVSKLEHTVRGSFSQILSEIGL